MAKAKSRGDCDATVIDVVSSIDGRRETMLLDFDHGGRGITDVPYRSQFQQWKRRLAPQQIADIKSDIHRMLGSGEVHTTSWMPGSDWSATPFDPIYWNATKESVMQAAQCFGLFVWECVLERSQEGEDWGSGHYEKNGYPIKGRTYFRIGLRRAA
jgi:hypothetical protein